MAVVTQEGGKLIDRELAGYAINNRNGQSLHPFAVCLTKSAAELDGVKDGACYLNRHRRQRDRPDLPDRSTATTAAAARTCYPGVPPFGQTAISNGPVIELVMPRADVDAEGDLYNRLLQQWPLSLSVTAENGLKEVKILDGDAVIRRFLPNGQKTFSFKTSIPKERQKYLWVHATDVKGREAMSRAINCNSWILRENASAATGTTNCSTAAKSGRTAVPSSSATAATRPRPTRAVGTAASGRSAASSSTRSSASAQPPSTVRPRGIPQCWMNPYLFYDGKKPKSVGWLCHLVADREGAPHILPHRVVASSEVLIGDRVLDGVFPLTAEPVYHVCHSVYPVAPSKYLEDHGPDDFLSRQARWSGLLSLGPGRRTAPRRAHAGVGRHSFTWGRFPTAAAKERIIVNAGQTVERGDGSSRIPCERSRSTRAITSAS